MNLIKQGTFTISIMAIRNVHDFMKIFDIKNKEDEVLKLIHSSNGRSTTVCKQRGK